ncbi:MAG: MFS transporter [Caldilineaceae bacterium]|nr:MFS transporter [Caldilineaceae bacterium]
MGSALTYRRAAVRWLLQLDRPLPVRSDAEVQAEIEQNYRWNFTVGLLDGVFFWFGVSFISSTTILPLFVSKLTENPLIIALLPILGQATWYLPQLFAAGLTERAPRKKALVIGIGLFTERLPIWLMPLAALISPYAPGWALALLLTGYGLHGAGAGLIAPAWSDMIARCFPVARRGWFFGFTTFVGTGLGAIGAFFSGWLLETYPFPTNFVYAFTIASVMIILSWTALAQIRETVQRPSATAPARQALWGKVRRILAGDHNFRRFLVARLVGSLSTMGTGFITVVALQRWQVSDGIVGFFTIALLTGQTLGTLFAGMVADRFGHRHVFQCAYLINFLAFILAWQAPTSAWFYAVFVLVGSGMGMLTVSNVLSAMEFSTPDHRPTYVGIANTSNGIGITVAPLIGGLLATISDGWLFAVSAMAGLLALLLFATQVVDPRFQPARFAVEGE